MAAELADIERRLRGSPSEPFDGRYSDRANLFAAEIYLALGLHYGRTMAAREHGCFAARWTEAESAGLPPPMAAGLRRGLLSQVRPWSSPTRRGDPMAPELRYRSRGTKEIRRCSCRS